MNSSSELTVEQLAKLIAAARRHHQYWLILWRRLDSFGLGFDDPLGDEVRRVCEAHTAYIFLLERMQRMVPKPYRPLASPWRNSGLSAYQEPWADKQAEAAAEVERHARDAPPDPTKRPAGEGP